MVSMGVDLLTPTHLIFLALLALIVFGPKRLPEIGRSLGTGIREFKGSIGGESLADPAPQASSPPAERPGTSSDAAPGGTSRPGSG
jgi:sec-independent protein translocase protein TatA